MKKLSKLKLTNVDKKELEEKQMNFLKGGETCWCSCACSSTCPCTGDPISNQNTTNETFFDMFYQNTGITDSSVGVGLHY
jgi:natural product precursor